MAGGKSTTQANNYLTQFFTTAASPTRPTSWSLALYTDATGLSSAPTTEALVANCPGYARQSLTFATPSNGQTSNTNDASVTATGAWSTAVNYYGILDQSGNLLEWCPLSTTRKPAANGDKIDFAIGAIVLGEQ